MDIRQLIDKINHFENKQILNEGVVNDMTEGGTFDEQELSDVLKAFDEQVNEIGGNGIPDYDKIISALDNGDIESAMEEIVSAYSDQDGGEIRSNDYDNYLEDLESEFKFLVYSNPQQRVRPNDESNGENDIQPGMKVSQGTVVKVNGNTVTVKTSNGDMMNMNIHDVDRAVAEGEDYATFEDRKNQTSIYKTLIKEFGYELDEAEEFQFSPEQEKFLGKANRQDPYILAKMPGPKPPFSYFKDPEDQAIAKQMNFGANNLNKIKNLVGAGTQGDASTFAAPAAAPAAAPGLGLKPPKFGGYKELATNLTPLDGTDDRTQGGPGLKMPAQAPVTSVAAAQAALAPRPAAPDDSPEAAMGAGSGAPRVGSNTTIAPNSAAANDERDGVPTAAPVTTPAQRATAAAARARAAAKAGADASDPSTQTKPAAPAASTWKGQTDEFGGMEEPKAAVAPAAAPAAAAPAPAAPAPAAPAPGSGYDPRMAAYDRISKFSGQLTPTAAAPTAAAPTAGAEEKKIARFKELLDKAKTASVTTPAATKESIGYFLNKLRFIESRQLNEALTPEEQKEMDGLYAELGQQGSENNPAIVKLINDYNSITVKPAAAAPAAAAPSAAAPVTTPGQGGGRPADAAAMANANWTHVLQGSDVSFAIDNGFGYDVAKWKAAGSPGKPKPASSAPPAGSLTGDDQLSINQQDTLNQQLAKPEAPAYKGNAGAQEIQKLNPAIKDVNKIYPGQKFKMPDGSTYTVKPGDTLDKIAKGAKPAGEEATKMPPTKQQDRIGKAPPAAPTPATNPAPAAPFKKELDQIKQLSGLPAAPGQSGQPPVMDPNKPGFDFKKASAAANAKKESVRNQDDAILERIRSALKF